jgi:hypothetical protein
MPRAAMRALLDTSALVALLDAAYLLAVLGREAA